ncbi:MAG: class I SAM-dependent methyltransferase [Chitinophagaceae bacterium]
MTPSKNAQKPNSKKTCNSLIYCQEKKRAVFEKKGYHIIECTQCGHRYLPIDDLRNHLEENYSDEYFFGGGDGYPNYLDQEKILTGYGLRYARILAKYTTPGKMLDVGCAAGFILTGFKQSGWDCYGVEPNGTVANYGRTQLGLNITTGGLESYNTEQKFDLISMIQVIGHFYDLDKSMQNVSNLLKQGGLVLVESWNMKSLIAQILDKKWHEYSPPSVVHWFSDETLDELFKYYGFKLVAEGHPLKKINVRHALSFSEGKFQGSSIWKKLIAAAIKVTGSVNLIYPPVDVKWYLFQKT